MAKAVIDLVIDCDEDDEKGDHRAMVEALHAAVLQICPGVTLEALERMLTPALGKQARESIAAARSLDHPKGSA